MIATYSLQAIDIDIEHGEFSNKKTRLRVIEALASVHAEDPSLVVDSPHDRRYGAFLHQ